MSVIWPASLLFTILVCMTVITKTCFGVVTGATKLSRAAVYIIISPLRRVPSRRQGCHEPDKTLFHRTTGLQETCAYTLHFNPVLTTSIFNEFLLYRLFDVLPRIPTYYPLLLLLQ